MAIKKMLRVTLRSANVETKGAKLAMLYEIINLTIDGDDYILLDQRAETLGTFTRDLFENIQVELWDVGEITLCTLRPGDPHATRAR